MTSLGPRQFLSGVRGVWANKWQPHQFTYCSTKQLVLSSEEIQSFFLLCFRWSEQVYNSSCHTCPAVCLCILGDVNAVSIASQCSAEKGCWGSVSGDLQLSVRLLLTVSWCTPQSVGHHREPEYHLHNKGHTYTLMTIQVSISFASIDTRFIHDTLEVWLP